MPSRRIDLDREISIQVPAFDSFVTEYSANVSTTGMFIKSDKPLPPDTEITFEFKIADDWKLIRGEAMVVWCRYRDEGPEHPAGMGVQFTNLETQSRRLISWIIEKHVREGGRPFDLDKLRGMAPEALAATEESSKSKPATVPAATRPTDQPRSRADRPIQRAHAPGAGAASRFRLGSLLLAGLAAALVLGGLFWLSERGAQSVANPELPPDPIAVQGNDQTPNEGAAPSDPARAAPTPPTESPLASPVFLEAAKRVVDGWSRAWSAQDVDAYLSYYSLDFQPSNGQSRSAWAATRRQRLQAPEFIQISITGLETEVVSDSRGRARFNQGYRSNTYQDSVRKILELVREDGRWMILEEKSAG